MQIVHFKEFSPTEFHQKAMEVFEYQYQNNTTYHSFCQYLKRSPKNVQCLSQIPFLPIEFFKKKCIYSTIQEPEICFSSSGTTSDELSRHFVAKVELYEQSFRMGFEHFFGDIKKYVVLALLPSYLERSGSSLVYMVEDMIKHSQHKDSGFYLHNLSELAQKLEELDASGQKVLLIGVSFALLDLVKKHQFSLQNTIVMETGGMKGRGREMVREELHELLKSGFGLEKIHSEYGMTELLSQAYLTNGTAFTPVPWLKILIRDPEDPLTILPHYSNGGVNVIDLANIYSCSFIATQDLGRLYPDGSFDVLGRFDHADIRGCNLMVV